jgi:hypothetical protein
MNVAQKSFGTMWYLRVDISSRPLQKQRYRVTFGGPASSPVSWWQSERKMKVPNEAGRARVKIMFRNEGEEMTHATQQLWSRKLRRVRTG